MISQRGKSGLQCRLVEPDVAAIGQHAKPLVEQLLSAVDVTGKESWHFAMASAGGKGFRHGVLEKWMIELAGNSERVRQIEMPNPKDVDSLDCGNFVHVADAMDRFNLCD